MSKAIHHVMRWFVLGVALAVAMVTTMPAYAQIAGAIGKPLPAPELPAGTIVVKAIAGSPTASLVGVDVTLLVNGEPRVARTDAAGHASFAGLPPGASITAKVTDAEGNEAQSEQFSVPDNNGARV